MPVNSNDISSGHVIESFKNSINKGDRKIKKTTTTAAGKRITFAAVFGSGVAGDVLRISDGSTTIDYTCTEAGGNDAAGAAQIGSGSDRAANLVVDEFVSKINTSALNITAEDNGGTSTNSSFTLTPDTGVTITITEDPANANSGNFGNNSGHCIIGDVSGSESTTEFSFAPFSFSGKFPWTIRRQSTEGAYDVTTS